MTADDPHEIGWLRFDLTTALAEAREDRPAPRPAPVGETQPGEATTRQTPPQQQPEPTRQPETPKPPRGLLGRLLRRGQ
jgi:hypothetical protein